MGPDGRPDPSPRKAGGECGCPASQQPPLARASRPARSSSPQTMATGNGLSGAKEQMHVVSSGGGPVAGWHTCALEQAAPFSDPRGSVGGRMMVALRAVTDVKSHVVKAFLMWGTSVWGWRGHTGVNARPRCRSVHGGVRSAGVCPCWSLGASFFCGGHDGFPCLTLWMAVRSEEQICVPEGTPRSSRR